MFRNHGKFHRQSAGLAGALAAWQPYNGVERLLQSDVMGAGMGNFTSSLRGRLSDALGGSPAKQIEAKSPEAKLQEAKPQEAKQPAAGQPDDAQ